MSETTKKHKKTAPKHLSFAVFVCSTSRYQKAHKDAEITDISGDTLESLLKNAGHKVMYKKIIADNRSMINEAVHSVLSSSELNAAIFCGGTGIAPTDVTIESVSPFFEKTLPGFGEFFRRLSYDKMGSSAVLSRAVAGVAKGKVLFCIPGSPDAVQVSVENLILPEAPHIVRHIRE